MRKLALLAILPSMALAQSTRIVGPNGSGGTGTAKVTNTYGLQADVTRVQGVNTTGSCIVNGTGGFCSTAMIGKSTFGVQVTAISSPSGITVAVEASLDGGTTWKGVWFENVATFERTLTISSFATTDTYSIVGVSGATHYRLNCTARTGGSVTFQATASDAIAGTYYKPPGIRFQCTVSGQTTMVNMTCVPALPAGAGLYHYVTGVLASNGPTAQLLQIISSTTTACGGSPSGVTSSVYLGVNGGYTWPIPVTTPLRTSAANSYLCLQSSGNTAASATIVGYLAP